MRYGLFSDVHSNLEAFQQVLEALRKEKVDGYCFVGDIVGYGADPKMCIQLLRDLIKEYGCHCVAGNHDYAASNLTSTEYFNAYAQKAVDWTNQQLDDSEIQFLAQLDLIQHTDGFSFVHANLTAPGEWGYIFDMDDAYPNFKLLQDQVCFIGHSHRPVVFTAADIVNWSLESKVTLQKGTKYIINIGSVGQPRDKDPRACYAIYDTDAGLMEIRRTSYAIKTAQDKIIKAGLPKILAERLSLGM